MKRVKVIATALLLIAPVLSAQTKHHSKVHHSFQIKQTQPDKHRILEIQDALVSNNFMYGTPSGKWDQKTKDALAAIAQKHGWQTRHVPDARVLILMGLGPATAGISAPVYPANYANKLEIEKEPEQP
jgi:endonuclease III